MGELGWAGLVYERRSGPKARGRSTEQRQEEPWTARESRQGLTSALSLLNSLNRTTGSRGRAPLCGHCGHHGMSSAQVETFFFF